MPEVEYALPAEDIDLPTRDGFARHTLVGLNLFMIKMAQQFPEVLGIPVMDPMLTAKGMAPLQRTEAKMVENAQFNTAELFVLKNRYDTDDAGNKFLDVTVRVENKAGHKFPSGVSFRRAFLEFEVIDSKGATVWHSGATDPYGVLINAETGDPLKGELWYDNTCTKTVKQDDYQPHYQVITQPTQVQIYQEVKLSPGDRFGTGEKPSCAPDAKVDPSANLTTSFLSICHTQKDNRLMPAGTLPYEARVELSKIMGLGNPTFDGSETEAEMLAHEVGASNVGDDPDYVTGGGDTLDYRISVGDLPDDVASIRATLHYQATPPFYLQDRFCTGKGANRDRLYHLSSLLDTSDTPIEDWKFRMVTTGAVAIAD